MAKKLTAATSIVLFTIIVAACSNPNVQLNITSDPTGASVYIDKAKVGQTPLRHNIVFEKTPQGDWEKKVIEVKKDCYKTEYMFFKIDDSPNLNFVLQPEDSPECNKPPEPPPPPEPVPPPPPPRTP